VGVAANRGYQSLYSLIQRHCSSTQTSTLRHNAVRLLVTCLLNYGHFGFVLFCYLLISGVIRVENVFAFRVGVQNYLLFAFSLMVADVNVVYVVVNIRDIFCGHNRSCRVN